MLLTSRLRHAYKYKRFARRMQVLVLFYLPRYDKNTKATRKEAPYE